jgi:mevalonate kinase
MQAKTTPAAGADPDGAVARGRGFGHGKVILIGEHAVVYDQPALAAGLSLGVSAVALDGDGRLSAPSWGVDAKAGDGSAVGTAFAALLDRLGVAHGGSVGCAGVDVRVSGDLPARSGLGSSAALAIAVARAVAEARGCDAETARSAAGDAEAVFHGKASGIDLAVAASGGVGLFRRATGWRPVDVLQSMTLCVGLSGQGRDTRAQVEAVARLRERTPAVDGIFATLGQLAAAGEVALGRGDVDGLGRLLDVAHGLLAALRVSSPELETLVHGARAAGAVGAKLTGGGGGGAVIALAPGHEKDVLRRWKAAGFDGFLARIGAGDAADISLKAAGLSHAHHGAAAGTPEHAHHSPRSQGARS